MEYIFENYDNILIVKDDNGYYYAPQFGIATLTEMCPGEGYEIFITGTEDIELFYPSDNIPRSNNEFSNYFPKFEYN